MTRKETSSRKRREEGMKKNEVIRGTTRKEAGSGEGWVVYLEGRGEEKMRKSQDRGKRKKEECLGNMKRER
jgi:hypothetical protein